MFCYLFFTLLFLLLVCNISCALQSYADEPGSTSSVKKSVEIFKNDVCSKTLKLVADGAKIKKIDNVFFLTTGDFLVAMAEAEYTKTGESVATVDFIATYGEAKNNWDDDIFKNSNDDDICSKWNAKLVKAKTDAKALSAVRNAVYDAKENKIYLLAVKKASTSDGQWEHYLFVGVVSKDNTDTAITWTETKIESSKISKKDEFISKFKENCSGSSSIDNSGFVLKNEKIVFVLKATNSDDKKNVIALVELKMDNSKIVNSELNFLHVNETAEGCYPYFLSWGEKIMMITTNCNSKDEAYHIVKESSDIKDWKESPELFYYLSEFLKDKTSFTTADISGTNVLLFAHKNEGADCTADKNCFTFWFSDGNRTYNIGENVFHDKTEKSVSSGIIFAKDKLFFLHQKSDDSSSKKPFFLTLLEKQLTNITATLNTWKEADEVVRKLCELESSDHEVSCSAPLPTKGLVGFLSSTNEDNSEWKDRYLYVNAKIQKGATFKNGLECNKEGQGAKWPVKKNDKNQPYQFTKYGFTLLATVKIDSNAESDAFNSVLGIGVKPSADENTGKNIGLLCDKDHKFIVSYKTETPLIKTDTDCVVGKTYIIALVLRNKNLEIYVDGTKLTLPREKAIVINKEENIDHFYFGAASEQTSGTTALQKTAVTITNVLLYNWPFEEEKEIEKLKPKKNTEANNQQNQGSGDDVQKPIENKSETPKPPDTSVTEKENETKAQSSSSPPPTAEDSAARVGVVGVLCFMLFGVFTSLGRYVY